VRLIFCILVLLTLAAACGDNRDDRDSKLLAAEARAVTGRFMTSLKQALIGGMAEGGPAEAIRICSVEAPELARQLSEQTGWQLGRTSLKLRNHDNAPDAWEASMLQEFDSRRNGGEALDEIETHKIFTLEGQRTFRYMKAIPTGSLCLKCHGDQFADEIRAELDALYPADRATGYQTGELRGAFTLRKTL
jgi:hypothetical protein